MIETYSFYTFIIIAAILFFYFLECRNLLSIILSCSLFSLCSVIIYSLLGAPDVAITEASISSILTIISIYLLKKTYLNYEELDEKFNLPYFIIFFSLAIFLSYLSIDLPEFGYPNFNHYYINESRKEIGIPAVVTSILASYRGYDTFYETLVIFIGGIAIMLNSNIAFNFKPYNEDEIVNKISKIIIPFIVLFGLYILFHGEVSPGGGFQAGAILASALITYSLIFSKIYYNLAKLSLLSLVGIIIYIFTGLIGIFNGKAFLNFNIIGQKISILLIEVGIGLSISATFLIIFLSLVENDSKY